MVGFARISIAVLLVWLLGAALSWASYTPPRPASLVGTARASSLPSIAASPDLKADTILLQQRAIWPSAQPQATAGQADAKPMIEQWSRIAVVKEAAGNFVLLAGPAGEVKPFKAGDVLPDGSKLIKVSTAEIIVRPGSGKNQSVHLLN